ncbi:hypothetical protein ACJ2A9_01850 [Anaerobacillus sp. MEB173]|uniref:hypothetical protein n=1 Tax=Anaerobacillus sp. MEB173 TaxID=3383345 RepID=UPI003F9313EB
MPKQEKELNSEEILTDAPKQREFGIRTDLNSKSPFHSTSTYAGDSVDGHKELEESNEIFAEKELGQANENNSLT